MVGGAFVAALWVPGWQGNSYSAYRTLSCSNDLAFDLTGYVFVLVNNFATAASGKY